MRVGFSHSFYEEIFAYLTAQSSFRKIFGPVIQRPWEAYLCLLPIIFIPFSHLIALNSSLVLGTFFLGRLFFYRRRFAKVFRKALELTKEKKKALFLLLHLSGNEIDEWSKKSLEDIAKELESNQKNSRHQTIYRYFFRN
jgi:hypothetical protein